MDSYTWQLYITLHTWLFGFPFLFFPNQILPFLGYETTQEPWIRVAGILFLVIGYIALGVYKNRIQVMLLSSIQARLLVVITIIILAFLSKSLFLFILAGIILLGVMGSAYCYYNEYIKNTSYKNRIGGKQWRFQYRQ